MNSPLQAVIDIGTNSVRLLVAEVHDGRATAVLRSMRQPRLGEGVDRSRRLDAAAMGRTLDALKDFVAQARSVGAVSITVVGTSALRDASNREQFLEAAHRECGVVVDVVDGETEAQLAFYGAVHGTFGASHSAGDVFVLDVGGGSTELAYGTRGGNMIGRMSADVGAVRMTEKCISSDPPSEAAWDCLDDSVSRSMTSLWQPTLAQFRGRSNSEPTVLAVGGTATTLAAVHLELTGYDGERVHGHAVSLTAVQQLLATMQRSTTEERRAMPTMQPERADIIVAGTFIMERVLQAVGAEQFIASEADLLLGVLMRSGAFGRL